MKKILALTAALLTLPAFAAEPAAEEAKAVNFTLTATYDSRYVLYGYRLTRHLYQADIYASYALDEKTTLWGGSWFGYLDDASLRELDGYVGLDRALGGGFSVGLAGSIFHYIEAPFTDESAVWELAGHVTWRNDRVSLSVRDHVDTESDGHLVRAIASATQPVNARLSLKATAEYGYALGYYIDGDKANHALFTLEAPIMLSESVYLTPSIARTVALAAIDDFEEDDTIYGSAISWSF